MSQQDKGLYYRALKAQGVPMTKDYRNYSVAELKEAWQALRAGLPELPEVPLEVDPNRIAPPRTQPQPQAGPFPPVPQQVAVVPRRNGKVDPFADVPVRRRDEKEMAGQRLNSLKEGDPIRRDPDTGFVWFQEEVTKPAYPKPRGRRVLDYKETGVKTVEIVDEDNSRFTESFEVADDLAVGRTAQIKVTLPSFQVGCYKDPRFPFKIHVYNAKTAFDRLDVETFYGGRELVPEEVKRVYVENVLCYDIRTVVRAIQTEHRNLQLQGQIR